MHHTIIAIHGVGPADEGDAAAAVAKMVSEGVAEQRTVYHAGHAMTEIRTSADIRVIEVNWSDVFRPRSSIPAIIAHAAKVLIAMLSVAASVVRPLVADGVQKAPVASLYRWALLVLTPVSLLFTLASAVGASVYAPLPRIAMLVLLVVLSAVAGNWLRHHADVSAPVWLWPLALFPVLVGAVSSPLTDASWLTNAGGIVRGVGFAGVAGLLTLAAVEAIANWRRMGAVVVAGRIALLYIPFLAMNIVTTWVGFLALSAIYDQPGFSAWEQRLWEGSPAGLSADALRLAYAQMEMAATVIFMGLAVLAITLPALGFLMGKGSTSRSAASTARDMIVPLLFVTPIVLFSLGVLCAFLLSSGPIAS